MYFFRIHVTVLIFKTPYLFISISTPILAFPQRGRDKTFPPWGKMKGGKWLYKLKILVTKILKYYIAIGTQRFQRVTQRYISYHLVSCIPFCR